MIYFRILIPEDSNDIFSHENIPLLAPKTLTNEINQPNISNNAQLPSLLDPNYNSEATTQNIQTINAFQEQINQIIRLPRDSSSFDTPLSNYLPRVNVQESKALLSNLLQLLQRKKRKLPVISKSSSLEQSNILRILKKSRWVSSN